MKEQMNSLEELCLMEIANNDWIFQYSKCLEILPHHLLKRLPSYVSSFGMNILEEKCGLTGFDKIWLTQWPCSIYYAVKHFLKCRISLDLNFDEMIDNKVFYYNSMLHEVIEKVKDCYVKELLGRSCRYTFFKHTNPLRAKRGSIFNVNCMLHNKALADNFIDELSRYITAIPIDQIIATNVLKYFEFFKKVLKNVKKVTLYQQSNMVMSCKGDIFTLLKYLSQNKLEHIEVKLGIIDSCVTLEGVFTMFKELFGNKVKVCNVKNKRRKRKAEETKVINKAVEINDSALKESNDYSNSKICSLEILIDSSRTTKAIGVFKDLSIFPNLKKLCINTNAIKVNVKKLLITILKTHCLEELFLTSGDSIDFYDELLQLSRPVCLKHVVRKPIKKLKIGHVIQNSDFLMKLFVPIPCYINNEDRTTQDNIVYNCCEYVGLTSLSFKKCETGYESFSDIETDTSSLKELIIHYTQQINESDASFLQKVIGTDLKLLSLTSHFLGNTNTGLSVYLDMLLKANNITQLCISRCFSSNDAKPDLNVYAEYSKLETLIWSNNGMDDAELLKFSSILNYKKNYKWLKILDLRANSFSIDAVKVFCEAIQKSQRKFSKLALCGRNVKYEDLENNHLDVFLKQYNDILIEYLPEEDGFNEL